jgi:hypothetical protein
MVEDSKKAPLKAKNNLRFKGLDFRCSKTINTPKITAKTGARKLIIIYKN